MKKWTVPVLFACLACAVLTVRAYDLKNPALVPVDVKTPLQHEPLGLVQRGELRFAIIYDKAGGSGLAMAVKLLQEAFERCAGTSPETFTLNELDNSNKYPFRIILGENALTKQLGLDPSSLPAQGYEIKSFKDCLAIVGDDTLRLPDGKTRTPLTKDQPATGTLWGVCDFTERLMGCRYYFPGDYGSIWPQVKDFTLAPVNYTDYPRFSNRDGCWIGWAMHGAKNQERWEPLLGKYRGKSDSPDKGVGLVARWRLANFMGPVAFHPGHDPGPEKIYRQFPNNKKDIFFTSEFGNTYFNEKQHIGNDFDLTNLKFADLIIEAMRKYYDSNGKECNIWGWAPTDRYVNFGQCDGEVSLADMLANPTVKRLNLISEEDIKSGVEFRNIYGRFLQYYAGRVKKEFPNLKVAFMPYQGGTYPPTDPRWRLPDNIALRVCTHVFPRVAANPRKIKTTLDNLKNWYAATQNTPVASLWFYHIPESSGSPLVRAIAAQYVGESVRACGNYLGRTNIFFDQYGSFNWSFYYSEYAGVHSMWNPDFNVEAAIDEHWEPFYGNKAGAILKKFHRLLKDSYLKYYVMDDSINHAQCNPLYPPKVVDDLEALLKQAEEAIPEGSVEEKRFNLLKTPFAPAFASQRSRQNYIRPIYNAHRLLEGEELSVDGSGKEAVWKTLKSMKLIDPRGTGKTPEFNGNVRLAWDDSGVYLLATFPYAPLADPKKSVWHNDSIEFFLSPGNTSSQFFHYTVDSTGQKHIGRKRLKPIGTPYQNDFLSPGFKYGVGIDANGWSLEMFVPFADLRLPEKVRPYDSWGMNVVSNKLGQPAECSSSSLTLGNNHNIDMYGNVKFLGRGD